MRAVSGMRSSLVRIRYSFGPVDWRRASAWPRSAKAARSSAWSTGRSKRTSVVVPAVNSMPGWSVGGIASSTSEATTTAPLARKNHLRELTRSNERTPDP